MSEHETQVFGGSFQGFGGEAPRGTQIAGTAPGEALGVQKRVLGPEHPDTLASASQLAYILYDEARYSEAEKLGREALDIQRRVLRPEDQNALWSMAVVASILFDEGHLAEAEKLYREALEARRRVLGPDHPDTLALMDGFATTLATEHRHAEAEKLLRETLHIRRRVLGPEHRDTLMSMNNLANILFIEGRYDEAEKLQRDALDIQLRVLGPDHPDTAMSTYNLGGIALHKGKPGEALTLLRNAIDHGLAPNIALYMEKDPDLELLHGDPRFATLVAHAKVRAAAAQRTNYQLPPGPDPVHVTGLTTSRRGSRSTKLGQSSFRAARTIRKHVQAVGTSGDPSTIAFGDRRLTRVTRK